MPIFILKNLNTIVITSYKVMYTNLRYSDHHKTTIKKVRWNTKHLVVLNLLNLFKKRPYVVMFVREPYKRILSLYFNKIIDFAKLVMDGKKKKFDRCQKVIFPLLNIDKGLPVKEKARALSEVTFEQFVNILPKASKLEKHYYTQQESQVFKIKPFFSYRFKPHEIIKMEEMDINSIYEKFGIDFRKKVNPSKSSNYKLDDLYTPELKKIISSVYRDDFESFNYPL